MPRERLLLCCAQVGGRGYPTNGSARCHGEDRAAHERQETAVAPVRGKVSPRAKDTPMTWVSTGWASTSWDKGCESTPEV